MDIAKKCRKKEHKKMKDPAFLFYSNDFFQGCLMLENEEVGVYIRLLCIQHQHGKIPKKRLGFLVGYGWDNFSDELKSKFMEDDNGMIFNARLEQEIQNRLYFIEKQRENGRKGGRPKKIKKPNESQTITQSRIQTITPKKPLEDEDVNEDIIENKNIEAARKKMKPADFQSFVEEFNFLRKSKFRANKQLEQRFNQRISEGYTAEDILDALKIALQDDFHKESEYKYLTIEFMLRYDKIEKFLNTKNQTNETNQRNNSGNSRPTAEELSAAVEVGIALAEAAKRN